MVSGPYPIQAAITAIRQGLSANAGYRAFQAAGGHLARSTWLQTFSEVRRSLSDSLDEAGRPLSRRPQSNEVTTISTKYSQRFIQQVDVYVRNRDTGEIESKPISITTDSLITRGQAIREALTIAEDGVTGSPDRFNEQILGGTYTGTLALVPGL